MRLFLLVTCACALLVEPARARNPAPSAPSAPSSPLVDRARKLVQAQVVAALAALDQKRGRFSRAPRPPASRRVRILDGAGIKDSAGRAYVRFAVDESWSQDDNDWSLEATVGCVYADDNAVFVDTGDAYRRAADASGRRVFDEDGIPVVCRPAATTASD